MTLIEPLELAHQLAQSQTAAVESDPATAALVSRQLDEHEHGQASGSDAAMEQAANKPKPIKSTHMMSSLETIDTKETLTD